MQLIKKTNNADWLAIYKDSNSIYYLKDNLGNIKAVDTEFEVIEDLFLNLSLYN